MSRARAVSPSSVPGQWARTASGSAVRTTLRRTAVTMMASSAYPMTGIRSRGEASRPAPARAGSARRVAGTGRRPGGGSGAACPAGSARLPAAGCRAADADQRRDQRNPAHDERGGDRDQQIPPPRARHVRYPTIRVASVGGGVPGFGRVRLHAIAADASAACLPIACPVA